MLLTDSTLFSQHLHSRCRAVRATALRAPLRTTALEVPHYGRLANVVGCARAAGERGVTTVVRASTAEAPAPETFTYQAEVCKLCAQPAGCRLLNA